MKQSIRFSSLLNWLKSTEMFARPSKQIPGRWKLVEYYTEPGETLQNIKEDQLVVRKESWNIEFSEDYKFTNHYNLPFHLTSKYKSGEWRISKNFIILSSSESTVDEIEFQFAVVKEQLKLLKKDYHGRIIFFGFFNRL